MIIMRHFMLLIAISLLFACSKQQSVESVKVTIEAIAVPALAGSGEANLARAPTGTVVLSWLEPADDAHALRFATLEDRAWSEPGLVATGDDWFINWADFPSVVPFTDELWAAHWLAKKPGGVYSYDVQLSISKDRGATWSTPITPHTDNTRTEHGFVSLYRADNGFAAVWLDGRNTTEESNHDAEIMEGGDLAHGMTLRSAGFSADGALQNEQLVDSLVCDCCQTDVAIAASGPVAVYRDRSTEEIRDIYVTRSIEGVWWAGVVVANDGWKIGGCPVNGPAIAANGDQVVVAWFTAANDQPRIRVAFSANSAAEFSSAFDVETGSVLGRVGVALLADGSAAVSWLQKISGGEAEIRLRRITAAGAAGPIRTLAKTEASRPSGFPQLLRDGDNLLLAWTDSSGAGPSINSMRVPVTYLD